MAISRRNLLIFAGASTVGSVTATSVDAQAPSSDLPTPPHPNQARFESGDFLWPKLPGAVIPYNSGERVSARQQEDERWRTERDRFVREARQSRSSGLSDAQIDALARLSYEDFHLRYLEDGKPGEAVPFSSGAASVGHVAILEIDASGTAQVIEALLKGGIVKKTYREWISESKDYLVWHGRLRDRDKAQRAAIAREALKHVGRPYNFWNFNLLDDRDFYCSKLAWLCVWRSQRIALDGNSSPSRSFWFSPKQMLNARTIARIHSPGTY